MLRSSGFEAAPIATEIETIDHRDWQARTPIGGSARSTRTFCARAEYDAPDLQRAIVAERPDALLVDLATWGALSVAEAWGGPWASFCPMPLPIPSRDAPPFGPGLRPARGPLGANRDRLVQKLTEKAFDHLALPGLTKVRAKLGLRSFDHAGELFLKPPLLLYMSSEAFDYPRSDWPENVVMVGPCAWDPPAELPAELDDVEAPLVLVTTSSDFQNDGALVRTAFQALAKEPYHVVATLPATGTQGLRPPSNASVLPFAPHAPILARSTCAITHGGMGVTQKALARGVPVCAVPFGRDQFEVARRVETAGAGSRLPAWRLRSDRLRAKFREAISHRAGAETIARSFASAGGARSAVDAFERRLLQVTPPED